jgi:ethanolaminephosphotransferase
MHLIITTIACSINIGISWKAVVGALGVFTPWQLAHWEEYHTGVMLYGNGYWGITEALYLLISLHWVTAIWGPGMWTYPVHKFLADKLHLHLPFPLLVNDCLLLSIASFAISYTCAALYRVMLTDKILLPVKERGHKQLGRRNAGGHLIQLALINIVGALTMLSSMRSVSLCRASTAIFGIIYALESTKLIIDHMAKEPFAIRHWPLATMGAVALNNYLQIIDPPAVAWAVLVVTLIGYLKYVIGNINEICSYLGIHCLDLRHLQNQEKPATS